MDALIFRTVQCPYCGEPVELTIDTSVESQSYIEDCVVCCRPTEVHAERVTDDEWLVDVCPSD
ncbi:MAG: CPXCG motif-containing cysteine-rich protein [Pseudomonadota bacterium]